MPDAAVVLACAPLGYCLLEQDGVVRHVNAAFLNALALPSQVILGEDILRFVNSEDTSVLCAAMADIEADGSRPSQCELRLTQPDGTAHWVMASLSRMTGPSPWIILQIQSIDDLKQAVTSLQKSETRWKYALKAPIKAFGIMISAQMIFLLHPLENSPRHGG
ncbi:PAS domain-containing protein [Rhizobium sp. RCAM05350]|nr:PAS domain-containing protein [Rhizobium sp. RCAM05350]